MAVGNGIVDGTRFVVLFYLEYFHISASLYHPHRSGILHLKSKKQKMNNKDKENYKFKMMPLIFLFFMSKKSNNSNFTFLCVHCIHRIEHRIFLHGKSLSHINVFKNILGGKQKYLTTCQLVFNL